MRLQQIHCYSAFNSVLNRASVHSRKPGQDSGQERHSNVPVGESTDMGGSDYSPIPIEVMETVKSFLDYMTQRNFSRRRSRYSFTGRMLAVRK